VNSPNIFISSIISLFLHLAFFGFLAGFYSHESENIKNTRKLIVQIDGIVADKQLEEKTASMPIPKQTPPPKPKPKPPLSEEKIKDTPKQETPPQIEEKPQVTQTPSSDITQQAQTIKDDKNEAEEINRYLSLLRKKLSGFIVYPKDAKDMGYIGVPTVNLTILEDGSVESVTIIKSSGYAILDKSAVEAVINSSPFEKPPRVLRDVAIEIYFKKE
jgi:protein TonB